MIFHIFSIRDIKAEQFSQPFFAIAPGAALRGFADGANGKDEVISAHPEDYELWFLGTFETDDGSMDVQARAEFRARAVDLVLPKTNGRL